MNRRTKTGLNILEAALLLGVLGDALLRATPWGLNVLLWTGALLAGTCALQDRWRANGRREDGRWLLLPAVAFAAAFAWRDSPTLKLLDGLAVLVALSLLAWRARGRSVRLAALTDYALALGHTAVAAMFASLPLLLTDVEWKTIPRTGLTRHAAAVARGLLIAVPLLLLFGALFMAADAVFAGLVENNLRLDAGKMLSHALVAAAFAWAVGGYLRGMLLADEESGAKTRPARTSSPFTTGVVPVYTSVTAEEKRQATPDESRAAEIKSVTDDGEAAGRTQADAAASKNSVAHDAETNAGARGAADVRARATAKSRGAVGVAGGAAENTDSRDVTAAKAGAGAGAGGRFSLGAVEVGTVLGLLDLLFAAFVVVQVRYFFGGSAHVEATTGLTYAEYARRGFFELVWVAALVLPLLLAAHHLLRRESAAAVRLFRALAGAQIALLFVIMASAVARMRLYQSEYGLTELRLYTTAFMLWLGLVLVWFAATVLWRGARERFACGALVAAFLVLGALHLLNPDAYIVRANAAHARAGRAFDAAYASALSADAAPALLEALSTLPPYSRCLLAQSLLPRWSPGERTDWRTWNVARSRARSAVGAREASLKAEAACLRPLYGGPAPMTGAGQ